MDNHTISSLVTAGSIAVIGIIVVLLIIINLRRGKQQKLGIEDTNPLTRPMKKRTLYILAPIALAYLLFTGINKGLNISWIIPIFAGVFVIIIAIIFQSIGRK